MLISIWITSRHDHSVLVVSWKETRIFRVRPSKVDKLNLAYQNMGNKTFVRSVQFTTNRHEYAFVPICSKKLKCGRPMIIHNPIASPWASQFCCLKMPEGQRSHDNLVAFAWTIVFDTPSSDTMIYDVMCCMDAWGQRQRLWELWHSTFAEAEVLLPGIRQRCHDNMIGKSDCDYSIFDSWFTRLPK